MAGSNPYQVQFTPSAAADVQEIVDELVLNKPRTAFIWSEELRQVKAYIADNPFLYQEVFLFLRRAPLRRSGYNVFYAIDEVNQVVEIIVLFHQKSDPDRLRGRLNL